MSKEACALFEMKLKQLSKILSGKKYMGGANKQKTKQKGLKSRLKKHKSLTSAAGVKSPRKQGNDDDDNGGCLTIKGRKN